MSGDELSLFTPEAPARAVPPSSRRTDPQTSRDAAATVAPRAGNLRARILQVITAVPSGLTDRELERREEFAQYGPSTVRKRRSELYQMGFLQAVGTRDGLTVWAPTEGD